MDWIKRTNELIYEYITLIIENASYYTKLKELYDTNKDIVYDIAKIWEDYYDSYYSIYVIMDSVEEYLEKHDGITDIVRATYNNDFSIRD